ncbi:flhG Antiactivator of flagellar biosynthesis FleN, an ATPase [Oxalobacteraceae bacterium]|jgi:flagellar biosynthesis protein FlhG
MQAKTVKRNTEVIGIASGKGGVGKTTLSTNLAVALTMMNKKVMLLDGDLGLANAQIALGCKTQYNLSHVIAGEKTLKEIIVTSRQGVLLVPGASGVHEMAAISPAITAGIVQAFSELDDDIDYLILDAAAGIAPSVLAFMEACQRRFIVVKDEPSSIADAYGIIKVMTRDLELDEIYLIPNMVESQAAGAQLYRRVNEVCDRFLGKTLQYLTSIESDEMILAALKKYQSVMEFAPGSAGARDYRRLADAITHLPTISHASGGLQFFMERLVRQKQGA